MALMSPGPYSGDPARTKQHHNCLFCERPPQHGLVVAGYLTGGRQAAQSPLIHKHIVITGPREDFKPILYCIVYTAIPVSLIVCRGLKPFTMCFSAPASFAASAGLLVIGAIAAGRAKTVPQRVLACIPLIFSIQQLSEGLLWLSFSDDDHVHWRNVGMYAFLAFAQVVWPVYVPLTVLLFEKGGRRKNIIRVLFGIGILASLFLLYCLLFYDVSAYVEEHHIRYELDFPLGNQWFSGISYILAAVISPLISSQKYIRYLGWALFASYLVTRILYNDYLVSVWCYFAAVLSLLVLFIIIHLRKKEAVSA